VKRHMYNQNMLDDENEDAEHVDADHHIPMQVIYPESPIDDVSNYVFAKRNCSVGNHEDANMKELETVVIQPSQPEQIHKNVSQQEALSSRTRRQINYSYEMGAEDADVEIDSDFDHGAIVDSDYDINDGDDDLYADNVDLGEPEDKKEKGKQGVQATEKDRGFDKGKEKAGDKGKEGQEDELYESEGDDLWPADSYDEEVYMKFKAFSVEDLHCPKFHVGQVFQIVELMRKAIKEYCCKNRVDVRLHVNDRKRLKDKCDDDCTWYLWASHDNRTKCFMVKKYVNEHTCTKKWKIKLQRARRLAMKIFYDDEEGQYKMLWDYGNELRRSNQVAPSL
jgi:hypothetical protein